jgi:hypothetical protein
MAYDVILTLKAERQFNALAPSLQEVVESRLIDLSLSPTSYARPVVSPPYPPGGVVFEFDYGPIGNTLHHFAIFFRYSQDETNLIVFAIGHTALAIHEPEE